MITREKNGTFCVTDVAVTELFCGARVSIDGPRFQGLPCIYHILTT